MQPLQGTVFPSCWILAPIRGHCGENLYIECSACGRIARLHTDSRRLRLRFRVVAPRGSQQRRVALAGSCASQSPSNVASCKNSIAPAQILQLDRALAEYGPEASGARAQLKENVLQGFEVILSHRQVDPGAFTTVARPLAQEDATNAVLASLQPKSEAQKHAPAKAQQFATAMQQSRLSVAVSADRRSFGALAARRDRRILGRRSFLRLWSVRAK